MPTLSLRVKLLFAGCGLFLVAGVLYPMGWLVLRSFYTPGAGSSWDYWRQGLQSPFLPSALRNTLIISVGASLLTVILGGTLGFLSAKTDVPAKGLLRLTALSPFFISQSVMAVAWVLLAEGQGGLLNMLLRSLGVPITFEILSLPGIILTTALLLLPMTFVVIEGLSRNLNTELEESAFICGASRARTLASIVVPLLLPGLTAMGLLCLMLSNVMFSVQGILGQPKNIWTLANLIYFTLNSYPVNIATAITLAIVLLAIGAMLLALQQKLLAHVDVYSIVGKDRDPQPWRLSGLSKALFLVLILGLFLTLVLLPYGALLFRSVARYDVQVRGEWGQMLAGMDLGAYRKVLSDPAMIRGLKNSLVLAASAAVSCVLLSFVMGYWVFRTKAAGRRWVHFACVIPFAFSGMILGLAFILAFSSRALPLYGTLWILLLGYTIRELGIAFKVVQAGMAQIHQSLEESALLCGSSTIYMARRILLPLMARSLLGASLLIFLAAFREVESSVLLSGPGIEVLGYNIFIGFQNGTWKEISAMAIVAAAVCAAATATVGGLIRLRFNKEVL